jgi:peptidoglycan/LPS O-acetylase OafA/YrhL
MRQGPGLWQGRVPRVDGRIPSLDGLRAVSIALVALAHLNGTRYFPTLPELGQWQLGNLGVRVFFVISGFLITTLLLEESERTGAVSLFQFYLRRCFRIFPAFYALCAVLFVLDQARIIALRPGDLLAAVTYTVNYHHDRAWYTGHIWVFLHRRAARSRRASRATCSSSALSRSHRTI